jgi:hypothetical protein
MKKFKILGASLALVAALAVFAGSADAQAVTVVTPNKSVTVPVVVPTTPASAVAPIVAPLITKVLDMVTMRHPTPEGSEWLKAEVIHADAVTLIVRERANGMAIHTFNFSSDLQPKMQAMLDKGSFQYGDKVSILFMQGQQTVALRIHGKASKSL